VIGVRRVVAGLAGALLIAAAAPASAQTHAPQSLERYFRIEWQPTRDRNGSGIEGYVYNTSSQTTQRIRLRIDRLDGAGNVVGNSTIWLLGDLSMGSRTYFSSSVPDAVAYRVHVLSFDLSCEGGGSGM